MSAQDNELTVSDVLNDVAKNLSNVYKDDEDENDDDQDEDSNSNVSAPKGDDLKECVNEDLDVSNKSSSSEGDNDSKKEKSKAETLRDEIIEREDEECTEVRAQIRNALCVHFDCGGQGLFERMFLRFILIRIKICSFLFRLYIQR